MKRKKILYIVEGFGGGVYTFMLQLANEIVKDYDVTLAYSRRKETPPDMNKEFDERIKLIELNNTREINLSSDLKGFKIVRKVIKDEQPDIIHLHSSKAGFMGRIINRTIKGSKNRQVYYNPHGFSFLQTNISNLRRKAYWFLEWIGSKAGGTIIAVSTGEGKESKKLSKKVKVINNAINYDELQSHISKKDNKETNDLIICTLARISNQKNPKLFNKIAEGIDKEFIWIGDGELKEELTSGNIEVTGWKPKNEGLKILDKCDVFILTSLWEGLPISLLEAMALGKVCIVSNVIGNRDVIVHGQNGFIANNENEFKDIIEKLSFDRELFNIVSKNAKEYVKYNFDTKDMLSDYKKVYQNNDIK